MRPERQHQIWRSEAGSRLWLSGLIAAMQYAEQPHIRREQLEHDIREQVRAHLALPATSLSTLRH
jgi:hypothetical protein